MCAEYKSVVPAVRSALLEMHIRNSGHPIEFPTRHGAFAGQAFAAVPPVVPDANRLRNDIMYACRHDQRTVLVNAANAGLLRLFCARHVVDEIAEHSEEWTADSEVANSAFLQRWLLDYLPLIRVVEHDAIPLGLLTPDEARRLEALRRSDADDVPSAVLALMLGAFFLSGDRHALMAVYGSDADLSLQNEWLDVLKAGGDAGELGRMLQLSTALLVALGGAGIEGVKRLWQRFSVAGVVPIALLLLLGYSKVRPDVRSRVGSQALTVLGAFAEVFTEYQSLLARFEQASPEIPTWEMLADVQPPSTVLTRVCFHALARAGSSHCSARELRAHLAALPIPHGEAKVRATLRANPCFVEVWSGRWQVGEIAHSLRLALDRAPGLAGVG